MFREQVKALAKRAAESGGVQNTPFEIEWDVSGDCINPVRREIFARHSRELTKMSYRNFDNVEDTFDNGPGQAAPGRVTYFKEIGPYAVLLTARCRKCEKCLRHRTRLWAARAMAETAFAPRTWMATYTLSPEQHYIVQCRVALALSRRGVDFYALSEAEQLIERHKEIQKEFSLMFKRMRKAGMAFRYLLVLEAHKSGLPHYHALLHESGSPMRYAALSDVWKLGFSRHKLVDTDGRGKAAWYAAKYLSKSAAARVRASLHYGSPPMDGNTPPKGQVSPKGEREEPDHKGDERSEVDGVLIYRRKRDG